MPTKADWNDFKEQMKDVIANRRVVAAADTPVPVSKVNARAIYLVALLALAFTLGVVIFAQNRIGVGTVEKIADGPTIQQTSELDTIKNQMRVIDEKICVLAGAHNNNWFSLYQQKPAEDIVYFGTDWKMNRRPPNLRAEDDRAEKMLSEWSN